MNGQLDLIAMFEGLSPADAKNLARRIRLEVGPELAADQPNPNRIREKVLGVYGNFIQRSSH